MLDLLDRRICFPLVVEETIMLELLLLLSLHKQAANNYAVALMHTLTQYGQLCIKVLADEPGQVP